MYYSSKYIHVVLLVLDLPRPRTTEYPHGLIALVSTAGIPQTISLSLSLWTGVYAHSYTQTRVYPYLFLKCCSSGKRPSEKPISTHHLM